MRRFVWDNKKAACNVRKHRVSFLEALGVLADPLALYTSDPDHPDRELAIGSSTGGRLLVVVFCEQDHTVRIISAREANRNERKEYEEG